MNRILVIDDEQSLRDFLSIMLKKSGYDVVAAENGEQALKIVHNEIFDLVITDVKMPKVDGIQVLRTIKEISPDTLVIVITAFATTDDAVEAMKLGAYDYITKPFKVDEIKLIVQKALEKYRLKKENIFLKREIQARAGFDNFIGKSEQMQKIFSLIRQVADTRSTVLITGDSGTGKELVARAIHFSSSRKESPFITVNCGALPETLLESELFGYMKGAFTGAAANKQGLFEAAHGGTIFLDEISATSLNLQIKLLRVIQERSFMRVGGTSDIRVDVRIIAASNKDLALEVENGLFREDLYYRLNVIPVKMPALRERKEDIPLLVEHFLNKISGNRQVKQMEPGTMKKLMDYRWPGNVRELENVIERMVILSPGETVHSGSIDEIINKAERLPEVIPSEIPDEGINLEALIETTEKNLLQKALEKSGGVKTEAAKLLGLSFRSFRHKLQKYESS